MTRLAQILQTNETLSSAARFALIGILGTLVDFSLFSLLHLVLGFPTLPSNSLSYCAGIINNYFFHSKWTFAPRGQQSSRKQFAQFTAISLSALLLNNLVVLLLMPVLSQVVGSAGYSSLAAKLCAVGVGFSWNFLANHLWTFRLNQAKVFNNSRVIRPEIPHRISPS
jgi:putative flippase GtrA